MTDRGCTKDYKLPGTDLVIKKGQAIVIPTIAIHHDERYYPNPEKFDPLRFSPENKHKINPYTSLAFGQGPRGCLHR
jgi:cytochrome P450 family 6